MTQFEIPLVSFIFLLLLTFIYISKPKVALLENRAYEIILVGCGIIVSIGNVVHFLCSFNEYQTIMDNWYSFINLMNIILMIWFVIVFLSLLFFVIIITYEKARDNIRKIIISFGIIVFFFAISVSFFKIELVQVGNVINVAGPMFYYCLVVVGLILFASLLISLFNYRKIDRRYFAIFGIIIVLVLMLILIQLLPGIILYDFCIVLFCYIMYFTIENPDMKMIEKLNTLKYQADSLNNAKNEWLKQMRHEINTPATIVQLYNEENMEIAVKLKNNKLLNNTKYIDTGIKDIQAMAENAVSIAELENKELVLEEKLYKTEFLLERINHLVKNNYSIGKENIKFKVIVSKTLPEVLIGDFENVLRIVMHLLSNAFKYTNKGTISLELKSNIINNICELSIIVKDSGVGIKDSDIKDLFHSFQRIDFEHYQSDKRGIGLGLSIVKQLSELMDGSVKVDTIYGKGSTFTVIIKQKMV